MALRRLERDLMDGNSEQVIKDLKDELRRS
jgi:hypothetical protein